MLGNGNINNIKVIYNRFIPFKGSYAITIIKWIFVRNEYKRLDRSRIYNKMINHESIHEQQILDFTLETFPSWLRYTIGSICFYLLYVLEWLFKLIPCLITKNNAYRSLCSEQEAYENERDFDYINKRKRLIWLKKIFKLKK